MKSSRLDASPNAGTDRTLIIKRMLEYDSGPLGVGWGYLSIMYPYGRTYILCLAVGNAGFAQVPYTV